MKRLIVDYKKLDEKILNLLAEKFPDGYGDSDIISFRNSKNQVIEAVEVQTDDTVYLVKVGLRLVKVMEDFEQNNNDTSDEEEDSQATNYDDAEASYNDD